MGGEVTTSTSSASTRIHLLATGPTDGTSTTSWTVKALLTAGTSANIRITSYASCGNK